MRRFVGSFVQAEVAENVGFREFDDGYRWVDLGVLLAGTDISAQTRICIITATMKGEVRTEINRV